MLVPQPPPVVSEVFWEWQHIVRSLFQNLVMFLSPRKDTPFQWTEEHVMSLKRVKQLLTSDAVVAYFNQTKETELVTDESPWGLSAILTKKTPGQDDQRVVAYASRSLSPVERR